MITHTLLHAPVSAVAAVEAKAAHAPSSPVMMHSLNKTGKEGKREGKREGEREGGISGKADGHEGK